MKIYNQLKTLSFTFFLLIALPLLIFINGDSFNLPFFLILGILLLFPFYLYVTYLLVSINKNLEIDELNKLFVYGSKSNNKVIYFSSVTSIEKYCSYPIAEDRATWLPSDSFFYYQINVNDNSKIIIPCFITWNLKITGIDVIIKKKFFPTIPLSQLAHSL